MNMAKLFTPATEDLSKPEEEEQEFSKPGVQKRKSYLGAKGIGFLVLAVIILQVADYIVLWLSDSSSTNAVLADSVDACNKVDILMLAGVIFVVGKIAFVKCTSKSKTAKLSPTKQSDSEGKKKTKASKKPERRVSFNDDVNTVRISELRPEAAEFVPPGGARVLLVSSDGMNVNAPPFVPANVPRVVPPRMANQSLSKDKENNAPANGHEEKPILEKNKWVKSDEEAKMWEKSEEKQKWTPKVQDPQHNQSAALWQTWEKSEEKQKWAPKVQDPQHKESAASWQTWEKSEEKQKWTPKVQDPQHMESAASWQQPQSKWTPKVTDPQEQVSAEQPQSKWKPKVWVPEQSQELVEDPEKKLSDLIDILVGCKWICAIPGRATQEHIITRDGRNLKCSTTSGYHTKVFNVMIDRKWNISVNRTWKPKETKESQGSQGATIYWGFSKNIILDPSKISEGELTWVKQGGDNWIWHGEAF